MNSSELEGFLARTYEENSRQIILLLQHVQNITRSNNEIVHYLSQLRRQPRQVPAVQPHPSTPIQPHSAPSTTQNLFTHYYDIRPLNHVTTGTLNHVTTESGNVLDQYLLQLAQQFFPPLQGEEETPPIPTPEQIALATRQSLYQNIVHPLNTQCPIRLSVFNDNDHVTMIRHCRHIFNTTDLTRWFQSHCRCPVCRYDIRTYVATTTAEDDTIIV